MNERSNSASKVDMMDPPLFGTIREKDSDKGYDILSLDDIFDQFLFSSDTQPSLSNKISSSFGGSRTSIHAKEDFDDYDSADYDSDDDEDGGGRKRARTTIHRNMTEQQKVERRERNREHAKRSRVRKKFLLESLQQSVHALQEENDKLKAAICEHLKGESEELLATCSAPHNSVIASKPSEATKTLDDPDYSLVKALQTAQQNFVISDPSLPDNPIVYASSGFLGLTGYRLDQVLGRNCRFLQGPATDPKSVDCIRKGIESGEDTTVVLLNYRCDGSTFWNQFFVAALRDGNGNVVNYLGVQCKVSEDYAIAFSGNVTKMV